MNIKKIMLGGRVLIKKKAQPFLDEPSIGSSYKVASLL